jgi:hypothetical protein
MAHPDEEAPEGWRELCALLRAERNPDKFREILNQIDQLLRAHEKAHRQELSA